MLAAFSAALSTVYGSGFPLGLKCFFNEFLGLSSDGFALALWRALTSRQAAVHEVKGGLNFSARPFPLGLFALAFPSFGVWPLFLGRRPRREAAGPWAAGCKPAIGARPARRVAAGCVFAGCKPAGSGFSGVLGGGRGRTPRQSAPLPPAGRKGEGGRPGPPARRGGRIIASSLRDSSRLCRYLSPAAWSAVIIW